MSYYEVLLFLHISTAIVWLGSAVLFFVLFQLTKSTPDPVLAERLGFHVKWLAQRLFIPASLAVLVFGILLTIEGPWNFDDVWILIGLAGWATSFVVGIGVIEPTTNKMHAAIGAHGPQHESVRGYSRRLDGLAAFDLALLFAIVWDMALKPTEDDLGTLLIAGVAIAIGAVIVLRAFRASASAVASA